MSERFGMVSRMLTFSNPTPTQRYELWSCPEFNPRYRLFYYNHDVQISVHPYQTEVAGRKAFERLTEDHAE